MEESFDNSLMKVRKFFTDYSNELTNEELDVVTKLLDKMKTKKSASNEQMGNSNEYKNKGNKFYAENDFEKALEMYTKAIEADNTNYLVYSNRSLIYYKLGRIEDSINDCLKGIEIEPSFIKFYIRLGQIYSETDKTKALEYVNHGLKYEPQNVALLAVHGQLIEEPSKTAFDTSSIDALLKNPELQNMVQSFVKDKSPEELNDMMKQFMGGFNKN